MNDHRSAQRKRVTQTMEVTDSISARVIGTIGNLSSDGLLLLSQRQLPSNALFQLNFKLPGFGRNEARRIEIGVHEQWSEASSANGQYWSGFRIIDVSPEDQQLIAQWVSSGSG